VDRGKRGNQGLTNRNPCERSNLSSSQFEIKPQRKISRKKAKKTQKNLKKKPSTTCAVDGFGELLGLASND
jgi:hypothetical protein